MEEPKKKRGGCLTFLLVGLGVLVLLVVAVIGLTLAGGSEESAAPTASESAAATPSESESEESSEEEPEETTTESEPEETTSQNEAEAEDADDAPEDDGLTAEQRNAVRAAQNYLDFSAFSRQGLIDQLSSEYGDQYSVEDATLAVDQIENEVDWNEQAARSARDYLDFTSFSRLGLIDQLSSEYGEQFTMEQATAGVDAIEDEVDWNEEAAEAAQSYLDLTPFSRQELIEQLSSEYGDQFTVEQATYGVDQAGL